MLKNIRSKSPDQFHVLDQLWGAKATAGTESVSPTDDALLRRLAEGDHTAWGHLCQRRPASLQGLVHSPAVMKFLHKCASDNIWPEETICAILQAGAMGPYVTAVLDKANEKGATKVLLASNSQTLPERALVWALETSIKSLSTDTEQSDQKENLDHLLSRTFSHNHLVGALRGLDSSTAIALFDFLIYKAKMVSFVEKVVWTLLKYARGWAPSSMHTLQPSLPMATRSI